VYRRIGFAARWCLITPDFQIVALGGSVTRRETGFLLIGIGIGLMFAIAAAVEILASLTRRAFITGYTWDKIILTIPFLLLIAGVVLLILSVKSKPKAN
jgi:hypothetical protein